MSTTIYYFSATGNSLFIAKELAKELSATELVPISTMLDLQRVNSDSDAVGLIFPVYFFGLPIIVNDFIKKFQQREGQYCFGLAIHGGGGGNALYQLKKECDAANIKLSYAKDINVCGSWIVLYKPPKSEDFNYNPDLQDIVKRIARDTELRKKSLHDIRFRPFLLVIYKTAFKPVCKADRYFKVESTCNGVWQVRKNLPGGQYYFRKERSNMAAQMPALSGMPPLVSQSVYPIYKSDHW